MKLTSTLIAIMLLTLLFESTFFSFPLFFITSLFLLYLKKDSAYYILVFIMGVMLDMVRLSPLGITPFAIFSSYLILYAYEKYFGSKDIIIASFIAVAATFLYSYFLHYSLHLVLLVVVTGIIFWGIYTFFLRKRFS